jgi:DNA primase
LIPSPESTHFHVFAIVRWERLVSFAIDNEVKDRVRLAVNIVDLIGSYGEIRRQGRGFVAACPFHDDRRPSLQVNPDRQTWKCWVCDIGGDVFSFVMKKESVGFPEALRMLADRAGIVIENPKERGSRDDKKRLYEAMKWATQEFHDCLLSSPEAKTAREYLEDRGITDESLRKFQIGFAPESWSWLLDRGIAKSFSPDVLESIGLAARGDRGSRYDRFRNRAIFPIRDPSGRPIAVGGRVLPGASADTAKYVNCSETRLYHKSHQLYGLDLARDAIVKAKQAVVMEGYTDVIMAVQHGIGNAVACCGTALGEGQIKLLRRYCDSVVLLLDGDEAGQKRTREILELFVSEQMDLRILTLPDGLDPCDYLRKYSGAQLKSLLSTAVDALEHKLQILCQGFDPLIDTHRANSALEDILETMSRVTRDKLLSSESTRLRHDQLLARLSRQFGVEQSEIRMRMDSIRQKASDREKQRQEFRQMQSAPQPSTVSPNKQSAAPVQSNTVAGIIYKYSELNAIECELFEVMALYEDIVPMAIERFPVSTLSSSTAKKIFQVYLDLELAGHTLDFESVLSAVEDAGIKNVLVSIEEQASRKAALAKMTPDERLHSLCERLSGQEDRAYRRQQINLLEKKQVDAQTELDLLNQIVLQNRLKHGLVQTDNP